MRVFVRYRRSFLGDKKGVLRMRTTLSARAIRACTERLCGDGWGCIPILSREQFARLGGYHNPYGSYVPAGEHALPLLVRVEGEEENA